MSVTDPDQQKEEILQIQQSLQIERRNIQELHSLLQKVPPLSSPLTSPRFNQMNQELHQRLNT